MYLICLLDKQNGLSCSVERKNHQKENTAENSPLFHSNFWSLSGGGLMKVVFPERRLVLGTLNIRSQTEVVLFLLTQKSMLFQGSLIHLLLGNARVSKILYRGANNVTNASVLSKNAKIKQCVFCSPEPKIFLYIWRKFSQRTLPECWELYVSEILELTMSLNPYYITILFFFFFSSMLSLRAVILGTFSCPW